jgi:hypothetical protein
MPPNKGHAKLFRGLLGVLLLLALCFAFIWWRFGQLSPEEQQRYLQYQEDPIHGPNAP